MSRGSRSTVGGSRFPPIAEYGFISDGEVCALVAPSGSVEWMCLPRMDGPSLFGAVLDRHAGYFRLGPADVRVPADRRYLAGTMVLETTWDTPTGWAVVRDILLVGPWRDGSPGASAYRRAPSDHQAERVLLRTARCLSGSIDLVLECEPAFDYGRRHGVWGRARDSYGCAEVAPADGEPPIRLTSDLNLGLEGPRALARRRMRAGEQVFCALSCGDGAPPETSAEAQERVSRTGDLWHAWIARGRFPDHPWRAYLQRSALTLKGLIYAPTGAMLGFDREAEDYFYFLADLAEENVDLQIMCGIGGERELTEEVLDHLSGYEGARPVRIGNGAWDQRQHDVWGVLLDSVCLHVRSGDELDERRWPLLARQVDAALEHWREPDQGIWEVRGPARHFTSSKVLCWVAVDRGAKLAELRGEPEAATRWREAADEIHADVCANGTDDRGVFCQHYETTALDASVLLIPLLGFLPPDDPRTRARRSPIWR